jgi:hypothetical protein
LRTYPKRARTVPKSSTLDAVDAQPVTQRRAVPAQPIELIQPEKQSALPTLLNLAIDSKFYCRDVVALRVERLSASRSTPELGSNSRKAPRKRNRSAASTMFTGERGDADRNQAAAAISESLCGRSRT